MKVRILLLWLLASGSLWAADPLQKFTNVVLVENPSNDGDSFVVKAGEKQLHLRLYFVDCPESVATTDADAKRVREQARYFGITDPKKIFHFGWEAKALTMKALAKPFTIYTAFANAMGRSPGGRVYAFVITSDGKDLARLLVENGYARTYGFRREDPEGKSPDQMVKLLNELENEAMAKRKGTWSATDADVIEQLREQQREEDRQTKELLRESAGKSTPTEPVDLNTATTQQLQSISGIGPTLAAKIIEGRPYKSVDDLLRISGVGTKSLEKFRPFITVKIEN